MMDAKSKVAENEPQQSSISPKKVLVIFEERRREVTFFGRSAKEGDIAPLLDAIGQVFADLLPSETPTHQLILQTKNEDWNGEFVDAEGEIPDKSVVKVVRITECIKEDSCEMKLKGKVRL